MRVTDNAIHGKRAPEVAVLEAARRDQSVITAMPLNYFFRLSERRE